MTSELTRPVVLSKIGPTGLVVVVRATAEECAAIAVRMGIPAVQSLECVFHLTVEDDGVTVLALGKLRAEMTRECVVSAEDFDTSVEDAFEVRFVPSGQERDDPDPDLPDEIPYTPGSIELGEAAVEQLGLALDPYPRIEGATMPTTGDDPDQSPFAVLARRVPPGGSGH